MAPRLSRRQQREQGELLQLAGPSQSPVEESESEREIYTKPGFAALAQPESEDENHVENSDEEEARRTKRKRVKKKKKKPSILNSGETENVTPVQNTTKKAGRQGTEKGKAKKVDDEIDKVLAELSVKYPDLKSVAENMGPLDNGSVQRRLNDLLSVSLSHLDSEAELRRFFGSKVVRSSQNHGRAQRPGRTALKSNLTKPQPTWGSASSREGLSLSLRSHEELSEKELRSGLSLKVKEDKWWTVAYSQRYRSVTKAFVTAVQSGDPEQFWRIYSKFPWHADTLLQMSEVFRHREEHSQSVDFLDRALFTYERSFMGAFAFTSGTNRLEFDLVENRPFFLALGRKIADLQRTGCNRTAFEFAKLLLSLDPYCDPHGSLLYLDFLAIRAGSEDWLLSFWHLHDEIAREAEKGDNTSRIEFCHRFNVTALPGWAFARALALKSREHGDVKHSASDQALRDAIIAFPSVVPLLADKSDIILPGELRGHPSFRVHVDSSSLDEHNSLIHLLSHLYAFRSSSLWKTTENASWLKEVAVAAFMEIEKRDTEEHVFRSRFTRMFTTKRLGNKGTKALSESSLSLSIFRHAYLLSDANAGRRLMSFFPRETLRTPTLSCDPLPPITSISRYDETYFSGTDDIFTAQTRTRRERELDARNLARLIPDNAVREQFQALFDANPQLQERFPGGVAQFAQIAAHLPEGLFEELILGGVDLRAEEAVGGFMPGALPDEERDDGRVEVDREEIAEEEAFIPAPDLDGDEETEQNREVEAEDNENLAALPVRFLRNLFQRLWGGDDHDEGGPSGDVHGDQRSEGNEEIDNSFRMDEFGK